MRIPTDSADARELRDAEAAPLAATRRQDQACTNGWLGEDPDGHPAACPLCRPHLWPRPCTRCSTTLATFTRRLDQLQRRCCTTCEHPQAPGLTTVLARHQIATP